MRRVVVLVIQWCISLAVLYALWTWVLAPRTSRAVIVAPDVVAGRIAHWISTGALWDMVWTTLSEASLGLGLGILVGLGLALLLAVGPVLVGKTLEPAVAAIYAMPKFVIIPLLFIWLGNGFAPRVAFVGIAVFAVIFVNMVSGLRTVDPSRVQMMELFGATKWQIATKLLLRHAIGYLATGLTFATSFAIAIAIGAEMLFGVSDGLGGTLNTSAAFFDAASVLGAIVVATVLSSFAIALASWLGRRVTWAQ